MPQRKKVLFLSHVSNLGGAEQVLLTIARHLNKENFCCELLTQDEGPLTEQFRTAGETICLKLPAWRKGKYFLSRYAAIARLDRICRERGVDLIYCNNYRIAPYASGAAGKRRIPAVLHVHDPLEEKHVYNFGLKYCPQIIAVSDFVRRPLAEQGLDPRVVYNGVDVNRLRTARPSDIRRERGWDKTARIVGWVANFTENKRPGLFLRLAAEIKKERPDYRFVVVGHEAWGGPVTRASLEQLSASLGLTDSLAFLGWRDDIPRLLKCFDATVLCSKKESFPLIVLEAMACGSIVFAQDSCGGPSEQIRNGRDGFLLDFTRTADSAAREQVKPSPMPNPSAMEGRIPFLEANASARPRTMQLTTIRGIKTPRV